MRKAFENCSMHFAAKTNEDGENGKNGIAPDRTYNLMKTKCNLGPC